MQNEILKLFFADDVACAWDDLGYTVFDLSTVGLPVSASPAIQVLAIEEDSGIAGWSCADSVH